MSNLKPESLATCRWAGVPPSGGAVADARRSRVKPGHQRCRLLSTSLMIRALSQWICLHNVAPLAQRLLPLNGLSFVWNHGPNYSRPASSMKRPQARTFRGRKIPESSCPLRLIRGTHPDKGIRCHSPVSIPLSPPPFRVFRVFRGRPPWPKSSCPLHLPSGSQLSTLCSQLSLPALATRPFPRLPPRGVRAPQENPCQV